MKMMFEELYNETKKKEVKETKIEMDLMENPLFNPNLLNDKLKALSVIEERELYNLLLNNYILIINDLKSYVSYFKNMKFLNVFTQVIATLVHQNSLLDIRIIIGCNKICYDYLTSTNDKDSVIENLMMTLASTVNKQTITQLRTLGLSEHTCLYLAMARYSTTKELVNVKRVNFIICTTSEPQVMTEQMIIYIYEKLYSKLTTLFEGIMIDDNKNLAEQECEIYSTISLAILTIIENMPIEHIKKVLTTYAYDKYLVFRDIEPRFSFNSLSADYPRILSVVEMLKQEQIFLQ